MYKRFIINLYISLILLLITSIFLIFDIPKTVSPSNLFSDNLYFDNSKSAVTATSFSNEDTVNSENINLIFDNSNYDVIPMYFRTSSNLELLKNNKNLNIAGLADLNISGSQQFSGKNLNIVINSIGTNIQITDVDLRQESHGFINALPISWVNDKNDVNKSLNQKQILTTEKENLKNLQSKVPFKIHTLSNILSKSKAITDEKKLVNNNSLSYMRLPVTDMQLPSDKIVDDFIKFINHNRKPMWYHFHCNEGIDRTTTFMTMYDMMKNYNVATADEIMQRQILLAGFDENITTSFFNPSRKAFLEKFYEYCKSTGDKHFIINWSKWIKTYS